MYKTVESGRLYKSIVGQIEQLIFTGELKVGDRLPAERELALKFGVSRTAVREAIKILGQKGLVSSESGRGTFVSDQTSRAVRSSLELMVKISTGEGFKYLEEVREILEPEIAARAALRAGQAEIGAMQAAIAQMDAILARMANRKTDQTGDAPEDVDDFADADLGFHIALAEAAHNPLIPALIDTIVDLLREQRRRLSLKVGAVHGQSYHKRILEAVIAHDPAQARQVMQAHLQQVREDSQISEDRHG